MAVYDGTDADTATKLYVNESQIDTTTLLPPRYSHAKPLVLALEFYRAARVAEVYDRESFSFFGETLGGHSLKHVAASGLYSILIMLRKRKILLSSGPYSFRDIFTS